MNLFPKRITKNDAQASRLIWIFSAIVFLAVTILDRITVPVSLGFDPHIFAAISAGINAVVALLLIYALYLVRHKDIDGHRKIMLTAMYLSVFFLVFYILHHLFTGETKYGDINHDGILSDTEKSLTGNLRYIYYFIISSHIILAGLVMPFVLFSVYRALAGEYKRHLQLVKYTFPIWLYVAITGVIVYLMINPYY